MDNVNLSIILPVFNSEKTVERTLNSILPELNSNVELIIIDDGSSDNSAKIIKKTIKKYKQIFFYERQNHGVSNSRNYAIEKSSGDFCAFIDSDDTFKPGSISNLIEKIHLEMKREIYIFNINEYIDQDLINKREINDNFDLNMPLEEKQNQNRLAELFEKNLMVTCWNKAFSRKLIGSTRFDEEISMGEDYSFVLELLNKNPKLSFISNSYYNYYRDSKNSLTKKFDAYREQTLIEQKEMIARLISNNNFDKVNGNRLITAFNIRARNYLIVNILKLNNDMTPSETLNSIKKYNKIFNVEILKLVNCNYIKFPMKIKLILLSIPSMFTIKIFTKIYGTN